MSRVGKPQIVQNEQTGALSPPMFCRQKTNRDRLAHVCNSTGIEGLVGESTIVIEIERIGNRWTPWTPGDSILHTVIVFTSQKQPYVGRLRFRRLVTLIFKRDIGN